MGRRCSCTHESAAVFLPSVRQSSGPEQTDWVPEGQMTSERLEYEHCRAAVVQAQHRSHRSDAAFREVATCWFREQRCCDPQTLLPANLFRLDLDGKLLTDLRSRGKPQPPLAMRSKTGFTRSRASAQLTCPSSPCRQVQCEGRSKLSTSR